MKIRNYARPKIEPCGTPAPIHDTRTPAPIHVHQRQYTYTSTNTRTPAPIHKLILMIHHVELLSAVYHIDNYQIHNNKDPEIHVFEFKYHSFMIINFVE